MGHGVFRAHSFTVASAGVSASADLGRSFRNVYLQIPTMTSAPNIDIYAARNASSTYYQIGKEIPNTTTVQSWSFTVAASAAANGRIVPIPAGFQFYKVIVDSAPTAATTFEILCGD